MTARGASGATATRCAPALAAVAFALAAITALAAPPLRGAETTAAAPLPAWSAAEERAALGLRAFADGQFDRAAELLATAEPPAELADWCLWALAEARAARAELAPARAALDELLAARPDSPLRPRALVRRL